MPGPALSTPALVLGPLQLTRIVIDDASPVEEGMTGLIFIPDARQLTLHDGATIDVQANNLVLLPSSGLLSCRGQRPLACTAILGPRRFLGAVLPSRSAATVLPGSVSVETLRRHVERLVAMGADVIEAQQGELAARSIRELLAAAAMPIAGLQQRRVQRENTLLDRVMEHLDAMGATDVTIASLCSALACSRSALYRAMATHGGLVRIVTRQRLLAVHRALLCRDDQRSIAEIARGHGFADASQFSRCFRRMFGVSAGQVRREPLHDITVGGRYYPAADRRMVLVDAD
jgi:AraC-like DNA-binding protein